MKKIIVMLAVVCTLFAACNNGQSEREKERADSIAADRAADSMLRAVSKDTLRSDSVKTGTVAKDSLKQ